MFENDRESFVIFRQSLLIGDQRRIALIMFCERESAYDRKILQRACANVYIFLCVLFGLQGGRGGGGGINNPSRSLEETIYHSSASGPS